MDFYWHYSSKELIDPAGKANFFKAIGVASQVFNTLSEVIQGPCTQNQQALAHSRLWDAVGGFLFLFSHMQDKLSKHSSQVDLLKELLNLQKDMITMMLSMLEGNKNEHITHVYVHKIHKRIIIFNMYVYIRKQKC